MHQQHKQLRIGLVGSLVLFTAIAVGSPAAAASSAADLADSPLALTVVAPSGAQYRLAYAAGQGWRFVDRIPEGLRLEVASNDDVAPPVIPTPGELQPQAVFIDGPSGNTFVWVPERRWRFVGRIGPASQ
jgi:hypothetical protein